MTAFHESTAIEKVDVSPKAVVIDAALHRRGVGVADSATTPLHITAKGITCMLNIDLRGAEAVTPEGLDTLVTFGPDGPMITIQLDSMSMHGLDAPVTAWSWGDVRARLPHDGLQRIQAVLEQVQVELEPWLEKGGPAVEFLDTVLTRVVAMKARARDRQTAARQGLASQRAGGARPAPQATARQPSTIVRGGSVAHITEYFLGREGWEHIKLEVESPGSSRNRFAYKMYRHRDIIGLEFRDDQGAPLKDIWALGEKDKFGSVFRLPVDSSGTGLAVEFWLTLPDDDRAVIAQIAKQLPATLAGARISASNLAPEELPIWNMRSTVIAEAVTRADEARQAATMLSNLLGEDEEE